MSSANTLRKSIRFEALPYRVSTVRTEDHLTEVCKLRRDSYSHHVPEFGASLAQVEELDKAAGTIVFYVQDKLTKAAVGTARVQTNLTSALQIEQSFSLPLYITDSISAEVTRFAISPTYQHEYRAIFKILVKTVYLYCLARTIRYAVMALRSNALVRSYLALGCSEIDPDKKMHKLAHIGNMPHRILYQDIFAAEAKWKIEGKAEYDWFVSTYHPDLDIFGSLAPQWDNPRRPGARAHEIWPTDLPIV